MKTEVNAAVEQLDSAARIVKTLENIASRLQGTPLGGEERDWLLAAARRLSATLPPLESALEGGIALPELKALRAERQARLEHDWLDALVELFGELQTRLGGNSPLIEALFPHQRFERLERPGAAQRAYRAEFSTRRTSGYITRMELDPEYPFLRPLLESVDRAHQALGSFDAPALDDVEIERIRTTILDAAQALLRAQRQARSLAEAALIEAPELFSELAFEQRARRRAVAPERSASEN
jgi:hypothetical protein